MSAGMMVHYRIETKLSEPYFYLNVIKQQSAGGLQIPSALTPLHKCTCLLKENIQTQLLVADHSEDT